MIQFSTKDDQLTTPALTKDNNISFTCKKPVSCKHSRMQEFKDVVVACKNVLHPMENQ